MNPYLVQNRKAKYTSDTINAPLLNETSPVQDCPSGTRKGRSCRCPIAGKQQGVAEGDSEAPLVFSDFRGSAVMAYSPDMSGRTSGCGCCRT
jgi:hypothetical protein